MTDALIAPASSNRTGGAPGAAERYSYDRGDFTWRRLPDGSWALHVEGRRGAVLHVVRDDTYPQMWRVRDRDGRLSDFVNLTRAKDAAASIAIGILNRPRATASSSAEIARLGPIISAIQARRRLRGHH